MYGLLSHPRGQGVADAVLTLPTPLFGRAAELEPTLVRSLDAVHLAVALDLGDELDGLVTDDDRMAEDAELHGVTVIDPTGTSSSVTRLAASIRARRAGR